MTQTSDYDVGEMVLLQENEYTQSFKIEKNSFGIIIERYDYIKVMYKIFVVSNNRYLDFYADEIEKINDNTNNK